MQRHSSSLLAQAHEALAAAEQREAAEQAKLTALRDQERQLHRAREVATVALRAAKDQKVIGAARTRLEEVERARQVLVRARHDQEEITLRQQEKTREARSVVHELEQRAVRLRHAIRLAERGIEARQRTILGMEEELAGLQDQLARLREQLAEARAGLEALRRELDEVGE